MKLETRYRRETESGKLSVDEEQLEVVRRLSAIGDELGRRRAWNRPSQSLFARWLSPSSTDVTGVTGLYLWGGVGRGKTYLCDLFFEELDIDDKTRLHFHRFMQRIHADLRKLDGVDEPMQRIADDWASHARLLLLDEIHVNDITDAMLLGGLLTALFKRGVTLITTSNVPPDGLYRDGLQRARFLPAIAQIKKHTTVFEMTGETDYRLRLLQTEPIYLVGEFQNGMASDEVQAGMQAHFERLGEKGADELDTRTPEPLSINDLDIKVRAVSGDLVWFDYAELCNTPRSTSDYIEIASEFRTVMISNVPVLDERRNDEARRLVNLVDEFYDRHVQLIISAEARPDSLYEGKRLAFEFERAASRLTEMQTSDYLAAPREHLSDS